MMRSVLSKHTTLIALGVIATFSLTGCSTVSEEEIRAVSTELERRGYTDVTIADQGFMRDTKYNIGYGDCRTTIDVSPNSLDRVPDVSRLELMMEQGHRDRRFDDLKACFPAS